MPNKTIYVADADLPVFARAQELMGGNLSGAIAAAVRRLVEFEESKRAGFEEVVVPVGSGKAVRQQRFLGVLLADWNRMAKSQGEHYRVWRTPKGMFAVHLARDSQYVHRGGPDGNLTGWRKHFSSDQEWGEIPPTATLQVFDDLSALEAGVPAGLYAVVAANADVPEVEDLDL